jgi:hypothetical protein
MKDDIFKDHKDLMEKFDSFVPEEGLGGGLGEEGKVGDDHRNMER